MLLELSVYGIMRYSDNSPYLVQSINICESFVPVQLNNAGCPTCLHTIIIHK